MLSFRPCSLFPSLPMSHCSSDMQQIPPASAVSLSQCDVPVQPSVQPPVPNNCIHRDTVQTEIFHCLCPLLVTPKHVRKTLRTGVVHAIKFTKPDLHSHHAQHSRLQARKLWTESLSSVQGGVRSRQVQKGPTFVNVPPPRCVRDHLHLCLGHVAVSTTRQNHNKKHTEGFDFADAHLPFQKNPEVKLRRVAQFSDFV